MKCGGRGGNQRTAGIFSHKWYKHLNSGSKKMFRSSCYSTYTIENVPGNTKFFSNAFASATGNLTLPNFLKNLQNPHCDTGWSGEYRVHKDMGWLSE